jgi:hypothetical protein
MECYNMASTKGNEGGASKYKEWKIMVSLNTAFNCGPRSLGASNIRFGNLYIKGPKSIKQLDGAENISINSYLFKVGMILTVGL